MLIIAGAANQHLSQNVIFCCSFCAANQHFPNMRQNVDSRIFPLFSCGITILNRNPNQKSSPSFPKNISEQLFLKTFLVYCTISHEQGCKLTKVPPHQGNRLTKAQTHQGKVPPHQGTNLPRHNPTKARCHLTKAQTHQGKVPPHQGNKLTKVTTPPRYKPTKVLTPQGSTSWQRSDTN